MSVLKELAWGLQGDKKDQRYIKMMKKISSVVDNQQQTLTYLIVAHKKSYLIVAHVRL